MTPKTTFCRKGLLADVCGENSPTPEGYTSGAVRGTECIHIKMLRRSSQMEG
jgi:hypothetical protein